MISVPLAGRLPRTPRPVRFMKGSITSSGKPNGYVGIACGVTTPINSQCPVVVSLPFERFEQPPGDRRRSRLRRTAFERFHVSEAEGLEGGPVEAADGPGDVGQRVRSFVAELGGIRQRARSDGVQHNDARARHRAILLPWPTCSD